MVKRSILFAVALTCVVFLPSCGRTDDRKPVYPVHGHVFDGNDRPAVGALVVFHPAEAGESSPVKPLAYVDEQGEFALTTYEKGDGAPEGDYVVTIEWREKSANPFAAEKEGEDRLHGRYSSPKTSKLRARVEKQADNVLAPFRVR
jgi:hypothetical protein